MEEGGKRESERGDLKALDSFLVSLPEDAHPG